ncbi:hypothetical protein PG984_009254 [Apiospora sp. TS-2023a]
MSAQPTTTKTTVEKTTQATPATPAAPKASVREPWNIEDAKPEGRPYTPFYGLKRGTSWFEKTHKNGVGLNWVCKYPQDEHNTDDERMGTAVENTLAELAVMHKFSYVWIIHVPQNPTPYISQRIPGSSDSSTPSTPEWSLGACFGSDDKTAQVYGNVFIKMGCGKKEGQKDIPCGLLYADQVKENDQALELQKRLPGSRYLDLYVSDDNMPQPFAPRQKKTRAQKKKDAAAKAAAEGNKGKGQNNGQNGQKPGILKASAKPENRISKSAARRLRKKANQAEKKAEEASSGNSSLNFSLQCSLGG